MSTIYPERLAEADTLANIARDKSCDFFAQGRDVAYWDGVEAAIRWLQGNLVRDIEDALREDRA